MYQPKVKEIQQYSDSQGEHLVHEGKLVLIQYNDYGDHPNKIGEICNFGGEYRIAGVADIGYPVVRPIIISETEEIEVGDWIIINYSKHYKSLQKATLQDVKLRIIDAVKVLALPEQFSDKHLQAITDGKMKEGDDVLIKCVVESRGYTHTAFKNKESYSIHLDQQNHITLFPAKQSVSEAAEEHIQWWDTIKGDIIHNEYAKRFDAFIEGANWAVKNNYKGDYHA